MSLEEELLSSSTEDELLVTPTQSTDVQPNPLTPPESQQWSLPGTPPWMLQSWSPQVPNGDFNKPGKIQGINSEKDKNSNALKKVW